MRILITGATGFVGRNVVKALLGRGHELALIARSADPADDPETPETQFIPCDLGDLAPAKEAVKRFDPQACLHLAWQGKPDYSPEVCRANLALSLNLVDFIAAETGCKKLIISGSCYEYGEHHGECRESDETRPSSFIAWTKHSLYNYSSMLCRDRNIDLIWFRIFYVYGPGQPEGSLIPSLADSFRNGKQPDLQNPGNANDLVYIEDVAEAFRLAVEKEVPSGIYNLGSGKAVNVMEVCRILEKKITGSQKYSDGLKPLLGGRNGAGMWSSISKAKNVLDWEPRHPLEAGIARYLESQK